MLFLEMLKISNFISLKDPIFVKENKESFEIFWNILFWVGVVAGSSLTCFKTTSGLGFEPEVMSFINIQSLNPKP
jgi:hypothetical protein